MRWRAVMQTRRTATARQARRWPSVIVVLQFPATVMAIQDKCSHPGGWALVELCQGLHSTQQVNMAHVNLRKRCTTQRHVKSIINFRSSTTCTQACFSGI